MGYKWKFQMDISWDMDFKWDILDRYDHEMGRIRCKSDVTIPQRVSPPHKGNIHGDVQSEMMSFPGPSAQFFLPMIHLSPPSNPKQPSNPGGSMVIIVKGRIGIMAGVMITIWL